MSPKKQIVIVGGGFGGIAACRSLSRNPNVDIHLIDRRNYHLFQPLLYQVAMAGLNPSDIATPIRKIFSRRKNVRVTLAEVDRVDVQKNEIHYDNQLQRFDYLILACGVKHSYFGKDDWETIAPGLKNIEQATEIRRRVLTAFEFSEKESDPKKRTSYLTFAVVGGGPTGVELAGAIAEMASRTLKKDYRNADLSKTRVVLIESGPRVLASFPEHLSEIAEQNLKELGVEVIKNTRASELSKEGLNAGSSWLECKTIIWAAGVTPSKLTQTVESEKDSQGRLIVQPDLSLANHRNIFVIGDQASTKDESGAPLPGVAPVAVQQGKFVGELISRELKYPSEKRKVFRYFDKGMMATIGRSKAVVSSGKLKLHGFPAWLVWVFVHIVYLMQFKSRVFVFFQWVWAYFNFGRGARLIVHKSWRFYGGKQISYD